MHWYKRDPDAALNGMAELSLADRGAYNGVLDILYARGGDVPDDDALVARILRINPRTWRASKARLITAGKIWVSDTRLMAKRVEITLKEARNFSEIQSKRARIRWEREKNTSKLNGSHMPSGNANTTTTTTTKNTSRKKVSYPLDLLEFWQGYPTDSLMSKKEAGAVWARLSPDDRKAAIESLPAFRAYCTSRPTYRPVHACRYLSQRRFDGMKEAADKITGHAQKVFVKHDSPEWRAWDVHLRATTGRGAAYSQRTNGWFFETALPPKP